MLSLLTLIHKRMMWTHCACALSQFIAMLFLSPLIALDANPANAHDRAWKAQWVAHCRSIYTTTGKTLGFTLQAGDSITHANPCGQWPRYGTGRTAADLAIVSWIGASLSFSGTTTDSLNYLVACID